MISLFFFCEVPNPAMITDILPPLVFVKEGIKPELIVKLIIIAKTSIFMANIKADSFWNSSGTIGKSASYGARLPSWLPRQWTTLR